MDWDQSWDIKEYFTKMEQKQDTPEGWGVQVTAKRNGARSSGADAGQRPVRPTIPTRLGNENTRGEDVECHEDILRFGIPCHPKIRGRQQTDVRNNQQREREGPN